MKKRVCLVAYARERNLTQSQKTHLKNVMNPAKMRASIAASITFAHQRVSMRPLSFQSSGTLGNGQNHALASSGVLYTLLLIA